MLVGDDRHEPVGQREAHRFSDQIGKPQIARMDGNPGVAEHRFRPGRGNDDKPARHFRHGVADIPQRTFGFPAVDLQIRDHRVHHRIPIDQALVAVNQAFPIEPDEHAANRHGQCRIHCEALPAPVGRSAEPAELASDSSARLLPPLPDARNESVAAEARFGAAFRDHLVADDDLGGDAGMIRAGLPEHVAASHAPIPYEHILQREGQRVPHMQAPRDIRGRHHDRVGRLAAVRVGAERARTLPEFVAPRLHRSWPIGLVKHHSIVRI